MPALVLLCRLFSRLHYPICVHLLNCHFYISSLFNSTTRQSTIATELVFVDWKGQWLQLIKIYFLSNDTIIQCIKWYIRKSCQRSITFIKLAAWTSKRTQIWMLEKEKETEGGTNNVQVLVQVQTKINNKSTLCVHLGSKCGNHSSKCLTSFLTFSYFTFYSLCFLFYLFTSLPVYFLTYLSTPSRIDPFHFRAGGRRRWPNLALVFNVNFML